MTRQDLQIELAKLRIQAQLRACGRGGDSTGNVAVIAIGEAIRAVERVTELEAENGELRKLLRDIDRDMAALQQAIYGTPRVAQ